jgi:hypothetical protein
LPFFSFCNALSGDKTANDWFGKAVHPMPKDDYWIMKMVNWARGVMPLVHMPV